MGDPLSDCSPLIAAAVSCKLRLVRLLVEGGAQVNGSNPRGETALLAACKALRGEPLGPDTVKLLTYLLRNKADPNAQDRAGRTALMYACMERAGAQVTSTLLAAGADPSMEDDSGASALVYAINAQHQPTLRVLMDDCRARGHDVIIIATDTGVRGGPVTRRYLNVPPSPDTSPVSGMSPSDIVLKTGSPSTPEGENIFNFRGISKRGSSSSSRHPSWELSPLDLCSTSPPRHRMSSEPWLASHNLARLNRAYEEGLKKRSQQDESNQEDLGMEGGGLENEHEEDEESPFHQSTTEETREDCRSDKQVGSSQATSSTLMSEGGVTSASDQTTHRSSADELPVWPPPHSQLRRNTLPSSVTVVPPPLLHLPHLVRQPDSYLKVPTQVSPFKGRSLVFLPQPPYSSPPASSFSSMLPVRPALLPPLPLSSSVASTAAPLATTCCRERSSKKLEQLRGERGKTESHQELPLSRRQEDES